MNYQDFIKNKIAIAKIGGFEVADSEIPSVLKPHQRDIVKWAIRGGCRAIFASFGLGKSVIQLSIMKIISEREKRKTLIIAPLGVKQEFVRDGRDLLGMDLQYVRTDAEAKAAGRYCITNYERVRDGQLNPEQFVAVTLDEASILRGFGTKTYQEFLPLCRNVKYKFVATATPSPNEYKELIHYAGYLGINRQEFSGRHYTAINNDCVDETSRMAENSIDLIHTSIPFSNHYEYTPNYNDFGHNLNNEKFFQQMDFLTPELFRILKPGRVAAIHVKDRILFGAVEHTGAPIVDPFSDETVAHFRKHGFLFFGRITIETDVVRENNQTYRLGWSEDCKDGTKMGVGCPEYLLLFRKPQTDRTKGYADVPVTHSKAEYTRGRWQIDARAKWNSSGNRLLSDEELENYTLENVNEFFHERAATWVYSYAEHVRTAEKLEKRGRLPSTFETLRIPARSPWVWDDVVRMRTLNSEQARKCVEKHICPLQLDIVERVIERWSNPGETVLDPFGGIMTVPYMALKMKRNGIGIELNSGYCRDGVKYLEQVEAEQDAPTLFENEAIHA